MCLGTPTLPTAPPGSLLPPPGFAQTLNNPHWCQHHQAQTLLPAKFGGGQHPTTPLPLPGSPPSSRTPLGGGTQRAGSRGQRQPHLQCGRCRRCPPRSTSCWPPPPPPLRSACRACGDKNPVSRRPTAKDNPPHSTQKPALKDWAVEESPPGAAEPLPKAPARDGDGGNSLRAFCAPMRLAPGGAIWLFPFPPAATAQSCFNQSPESV